jgi:arginyl-tRNA synthetase
MDDVNMNRTNPEHAFENAIRKAASAAIGIVPETIPVNYPPSPDLGDLATPVCFELAKRARRAPRALAQLIVDGFEPDGVIERVEVAGPGYINAFFNRADLLTELLSQPEADRSPASRQQKIIVEHTNINPNKAAHIGHLRNAVLGDTLVRFLRRLGYPVEIHNYIDDTGVQVADLVVGFSVLRNEGLKDVREKYAAAALAARNERFDYIAWDLYAEVTRFYTKDPSAKNHRVETLKAMEEGGNPTAELAALIARRMVRQHLITMDRLDIRYEILPRESDILALNFWQKAFGLFKSSGAIRMENKGKNAGCWVMDLPEVEGGAGEDQKVIVRSNGVATYVAKDMAYQMWKFALLGQDFNYHQFGQDDPLVPYPIWRTSSEADTPDHPPFGAADKVYNVIDTRQAYLQRVVQLGLRSLGHDTEADNSIHYSYEMVALTPATLMELFPDFPLSDEDRAKPYLEMSGRRGLGVKADDLLDALYKRLSGEIRKRNPELTPEQVNHTAKVISSGALRYYMLRFARNRVVAFDLDSALAFEGETGPYIQYAAVRARKILEKVAARFGSETTTGPALATTAELDALPADSVAEHWRLVQLLLRIPPTLEAAVESLELSQVAKHAHLLAQTFNSFYHRFPVMKEEQAVVRITRVALVRLFHDGMVDLLGLMGIKVPERM